MSAQYLLSGTRILKPVSKSEMESITVMSAQYLLSGTRILKPVSKSEMESDYYSNVSSVFTIRHRDMKAS